MSAVTGLHASKIASQNGPSPKRPLDIKIGQNDSIQHNMSKLNGRLDTVDQKISDMESKIRDIERSRDFDTQSVSDLSKQRRELDSLINKRTYTNKFMNM